MKKENIKIFVLMFVIMCLVSVTFVLVQGKTTYHNEKIGTYLTHVNDNEVGPPIIFYDSKNPWSVRLQLVDYYFDGNAFSWNITNKSILFTDGFYIQGFHLFEDGRISKIAYYRLGSPIWYDIEYKETSNIFGTSYHVIDASVVEPSVVYTLGGNATLKWDIVEVDENG